MALSSPQSGLKIVYKILTVILCLFWGILVLGGFSKCTARAYIYPVKFKEQIFSAADAYGFDRALILSIVKVESGFNQKAESNAGAQGLMQITPSTAKYIAEILAIKNYDMFDAEDNIRFGCFYLKYLCDKFGNEKTAVAAYNAGEGNVILWLANPEYSTDNITLKYIPFPETRTYVGKIYDTLKKYKNLYGYILDKSD